MRMSVHINEEPRARDPGFPHTAKRESGDTVHFTTVSHVANGGDAQKR